MREGSVPMSELQKLFFLRDNFEFPELPPLRVFDSDHEGEKDDEWGEFSDWYIWVNDSGELRRMKGEPASGRYFGTGAASWRDVYSEFFHFYTQHAPFHDVTTLIDYLLTDMRHLATSMAKIGLFDHLYQTSSFNPDRFVRSEIEYIVTTCRSMFETLYKVIRNTWQHLEFPAKQQLPDEFKGVLTQGGEPVELDYLREELHVPPNLAEFFVTTSEKFLTIREARNAIVHHGDTVEAIFRSEDGLSVRVNDTILSHFPVWSDEQIRNERIAPIWPPIAHIISETIQTLNQYAKALQYDSSDWPEPIAPNHIVFLRGECLHFLPHLNYLIESDPYGVWVREDVRIRFVEEGGPEQDVMSIQPDN